MGRHGGLWLRSTAFLEVGGSHVLITLTELTVWAMQVFLTWIWDPFPGVHAHQIVVLFTLNMLYFINVCQ